MQIGFGSGMFYTRPHQPSAPLFWTTAEKKDAIRRQKLENANQKDRKNTVRKAEADKKR